jgi:hypothetical protein
MAIPGPFLQVCIGLLSILILLTLCLFFLIWKNNEGIVFLVLNLMILFSAFKSGFVRHDVHILEFLGVFTIYFGILLVLLLNSTNNYDKKAVYPLITLIIVCIGLFIAITYITAPWVLQFNVVTHGPSDELTLQLLGNQTYFDRLVNEQKEKIKNEYQVNATLINSIDNSSVDIFPWDIALCWAYDLDWTPRPVFQSYTVYTTYLDTINSQHFINPTLSPQKILYSYESIDNRYPLFEEPETFRTILDNYSYIGKSGSFYLLNRTTNLKKRTSTNISITIARMGDEVQIPPFNGEIFGDIDIRYSTLGDILKILYKPAPVYIRFHLINGETSQSYRLIPDTAKDGLFLSQYIPDQNMVPDLFQGKITNNIKSISIDSDSPEEYSQNIIIHFTGISGDT